MNDLSSSRGRGDGADLDAELSFGDMPTLKRQGFLDDWGGRQWKKGEKILGRYQVEEELGQGGMGVVYGCMDLVGGVPVAVKALPPELARNSAEMEEVRENFQLVGELRHPNIAGVRTLEKDARGEYFLVMDIAEGESLRRWMKGKRGAGPGKAAGREGIPLREAAGILRQVASALDYAHGEHVMHRDIKPGNVKIDGQGRVKVLDFGLAAQIRTSMSRVSMETWRTSGTRMYMAPEQWEGKRQGARTDQYALAAMAYEMLSGHLPFEGDDPEVLRGAVLRGEAEDIPGLPAKAMKALRRGLAKRPEDRFPTCGEFVEALEGNAAVPGALGKGIAGGRGAWAAAAVAVPVLAAALVAAWWWWRYSPDGAGAPASGKPVVEPVPEPVGPMVHDSPASAETVPEGTKELAVQAREKLGEALAKGYDPGQGFGMRLERMKEAARRGEDALENGNAAEAEGYFETVLSDAEWLEAGESARIAAAGARQLASEAKQAAEAADGRGEDEYAQGNEAWTSACGAFDRGDFQKAGKDWEMAADSFGQAKTAAENRRRQPQPKSIPQPKSAPASVPVPPSKPLSSPKPEPVPAARPQPEYKAGDARVFMLPGRVKMEMVWCPPGSFTMGSPEGEFGREWEETPHPVRLTRGFWIGKYEVMQGQWEGVMGRNPSAIPLGSRRPVQCVSWLDCQEFCRKLGPGWRLPTEAEWEYACRAGATGAFGGDGDEENAGWFAPKSMARLFASLGGTSAHETGEKPANAWGLHDMHGNVAEWCQDAYIRDWYAQAGAEGTVVDPVAPERGIKRCVRGGSFKNSGRDGRCASRDFQNENTATGTVGLRVVFQGTLPAH